MARDDDVVEFHRDCNNKKGIKGLFILSMNTGSKIEQPLKERRKKFLGPGY